MSVVRHVLRRGRPVQLALVFVCAFALGSGTVAAAATAGIPIGSLFYLTQVNGNPTTPCNTVTAPSGPTTTCNAVVDSNGNLHVATSGTSTVSGTVGVNNFPSDQQVHGSVEVSNFPSDQKVNGSVAVNNLPSDQQVHGSVNVGNFPASQTVDGTVNVGNLPTDASGNVKVAPQGTQNVNVVGGITAGALPVATKAQRIQLSLASGTSQTVTLNMTKITFIHLEGCSFWAFTMSGGGVLDLRAAQDYFFAIPLDVTSLRVGNSSLIGCGTDTQVIGY